MHRGEGARTGPDSAVFRQGISGNPPGPARFRQCGVSRLLATRRWAIADRIRECAISWWPVAAVSAADTYAGAGAEPDA